MGRLLGIDFGNRRIGIAVSDPLKIIAYPHSVIDRKQTPEYLSILQNLIISLDIDFIIVGYPINMKGNASAQTGTVREFINEIRDSLRIKIEIIDERLSSKSAEQTLRLKGISASRHRGEVDKTAAAIILQEYLDSAW